MNAIILTPRNGVLLNALTDVRDALALAARRLGPAPRGLLQAVVAAAHHAARYGEALPVSAVNEAGQLTERMPSPSGRVVWPINGEDWHRVAAQARDVLIEAAVWSQKENATAEECRGAGADLMAACYEIESKGGRQPI